MKEAGIMMTTKNMIVFLSLPSALLYCNFNTKVSEFARTFLKFFTFFCFKSAGVTSALGHRCQVKKCVFNEDLEPGHKPEAC